LMPALFPKIRKASASRARCMSFIAVDYVAAASV
jgi:hypothetical protein